MSLPSTTDRTGGPLRCGPLCRSGLIRSAAWLAAVCLGGLAGCDRPHPVQVQGAVVRPGPFPHRPGWLAGDYIVRAGGYLAEADTGAATLARWPSPDGAGEMAYDQRRVWALSAAPSIAPGDQILVLDRTYPVRLDTVRQIADVVLDYRNRRYRVPDGLLVAGWTDRGVTAAVIIGEGDVVRDGATIAKFHYLYLRLHPDRYPEFLPDPGPVVADRDGLEDAVAIHHSMTEHAGYVSSGEARIPPSGHLYVQAGVWLNPRRTTDPGPGMRRRRFPDGRVWTTFPDGRQRTRYPDGRTVVTFSGGATEVRHGDGRVAFTDAVGNRHTRHGDGLEAWELVGGNRVTSFPDGRRRYELFNGTVRTLAPDGTDSTLFSDGTVHVTFPSGLVVLVDPFGNREERFPGGRVEVATAEGHEVMLHPDGRQVTHTKDGTVVEDFPDGRRVQRNPSGDLIEVYPDGRRRITYGDSVEMVRREDGSSRLTYPDASVLEIHSDGHKVFRMASSAVLEIYPDNRRVQRWPDGHRTELLPDGRRIDTYPNGNRFEAWPDGRDLRTYAEPYAYRGPVLGELVDLSPVLPRDIEPGGTVRAQGSVQDTVRGLQLAAFRLPDGDVILEEVRPDRGTFAVSLELTEPGHYRLQLLADLGGMARRIVSDRLLRVGQPPGLVAPVLEVRPYPGSRDAEARLRLLIDRARLSSGRRPLRPNTGLARVARARLEEMLALDYFSHVSPTGRGVLRLLRADRMRFRAVGENLGQAGSLAEVHHQLMLSAGHRKNILDRMWSDVGVACVQQGVGVWVVEVFGRR